MLYSGEDQSTSGGSPMSGTKRVPVTRTPIPQITPKAIELFRQYRRSYGKRSDDLHYALWEELRCKPWEWPCCEDPRADVNPYPPGTPAHATWQPNLRAQEMWKQLDAASREAKKAERETRKAAPSPPPNQPPEPPAA
jgi:hypothetical protein